MTEFVNFRGLRWRICWRLPRGPAREDEIARMRDAYGDLADEIASGQSAFLDLTEADFDVLKRKILDHWDEIQAAAAQVPSAETIADLLRTVGGPVTVADLGLSAEEQALAAANGHYLRDRFTVRKLVRALGMQ